MAEPNFIERNPTVIEQQSLAIFEAGLDRTLFPAQAARLLLNVLVYCETLVRIRIQNAALMNLVNYAIEGFLDQLGAFTATTRLAATAATVNIQFSVTTALATAVDIPAGTRVSGGDIRFQLDSPLTIPAGATNVTGQCTAVVPGVLANGIEIGKITQLVDPVVGANVAVTNTTISSGGTATETDDRYRARIKLAPNRFSVAGSEGAYRFHTLSADPSIIDVAIVSEPPILTIRIYPLTSDGLPSAAIIQSVLDTVSADTVRPLTDIVAVESPTQTNYDLAATITLLTSADEAALATDLDAAAKTYTDDRKAGLGRDIVHSQIIAALSLSGVYKVEVTSPAADIILASNEWATVGITTITISPTKVVG